jgi:hypothetical protein
LKKMTFPWRVAVTLAMGAGLALAIVGLWHTLAAEAGARTRLHTFDDIRARYASVQAYQVDQAAAGRRLQTARTVVAAALGLLLTGVLLTWLARPPPPSPRLPEGHPPRRHRLPHPNLRRRRHRSAGRRRRASACRDPAHRHHEPGRDPHLPAPDRAERP